MAKPKGGPTFFEVLRTTNSRSTPGQALECKKAEEPIAPAVPAAPPTPPPLDLARELSPAPVAPVIRHVEEDPTPDVRGINISYTVAAFAALVAVVGILASFWFGVKQGRGMAAPSITPPPIVQKDAPKENPAPAVARWYTIKLYSWGFLNDREKAVARKFAVEHQQALAAKGYDARISETAKEVVLIYGKFKDRNEGKNVLDALRKFSYNSDLRFAKADFVLAE
jgi:hypothetical protein